MDRNQRSGCGNHLHNGFRDVGLRRGIEGDADQASEGRRNRNQRSPD